MFVSFGILLPHLQYRLDFWWRHYGTERLVTAAVHFVHTRMCSYLALLWTLSTSGNTFLYTCPLKVAQQEWSFLLRVKSKGILNFGLLVFVSCRLLQYRVDCFNYGGAVTCCGAKTLAIASVYLCMYMHSAWLAKVYVNIRQHLFGIWWWELVLSALDLPFLVALSVQ